MSLDNTGFYTLSEERCKNQSIDSPLQRCELILTSKCNFKCPYCRPLRSEIKGDLDPIQAHKTLNMWCEEGLKNVRFSGGEPTLYKALDSLVVRAKQKNLDNIAISTNGSADLDTYKKLIDCGVNDFSISLDACCSALGEKMCGGIKCVWERVTDNIKELAKRTYVTVGVVLTEDNIKQTLNTIRFADELGVADIRIITAAQYNIPIQDLINIDKAILDRHPILKYRVNNFLNNVPIRGIGIFDHPNCELANDDMVVAGKWHFTCIIHSREGGSPIGEMGDDIKVVRQARYEWLHKHDSFADPICQKNCLDVCVKFNNTKASYLASENCKQRCRPYCW